MCPFLGLIDDLVIENWMTLLNQYMLSLSLYLCVSASRKKKSGGRNLDEISKAKHFPSSLTIYVLRRKVEDVG